MTIIAAITLALAVLGSVLGIINTWHAVSDRRVRVRVRPVNAYTQRGIFLGIEITNLSSFPLTFSDVGLLYERPKGPRPERAVIGPPVLFDGGAWPRRLASRESVTVYAPLSAIPRGRRFWGAYAGTDCGEIAWGKSPALAQISDEAAKG